MNADRYKGAVHVYPSAGPVHVTVEMDEEHPCWCHPEVEAHPDSDLVVIHRLMN